MHEVLAKSILSAENGMNLYRGCTHGCIYCDANELFTYMRTYEAKHAGQQMSLFDLHGE